MGVSYIYLLLTSRKGITNIKKRVTNIKERVTGECWGALTNIGEELQTLGSNYKHWLTLWSSGETLGSKIKTGKIWETTKNIDKRKQWQWLGLEQDLNYGYGAQWGKLGSKIKTGRIWGTLASASNGNVCRHNWNWGWSKIKTSHLRD